MPFLPLQNLEFDDPGDAVQAPWKLVRGAVFVSIVDGIRKADKSLQFEIPSTQLAEAPLPFYSNARLLRLRDGAWEHPRRAIFYLVSGNTLRQLNGTSPLIHEVNASEPIRLTQDNIIDYVKFFNFFVRGHEGPFHVLESETDPALTELEDDELDVVRGVVRPATFEGFNDRGVFLVDATIGYSHGVFQATLQVEQNGMVSMTDDEPLVQSIVPQLVDAPIE